MGYIYILQQSENKAENKQKMPALPPLTLKEDVANYIKLALNISDVKDADEKFENLLIRLGIPPLFTTLRVNTLSKYNKENIKEIVASSIQKTYEDRGWMKPVIHFHPSLEEVLVVEGRGPDYTIKPLDREMVVDLACGMAVLRGADVFNGGIMAVTDSVTRGSCASVYADIEAKCLRGTKTYKGRKIFLGNGISQTDRQALFGLNEVRSGVGIQMTECLFQCPSLSDIHSDLVFPQNLPSIVCSKVLEPQPGETILDMCAAPGGKTVHIATLMKNKGRVVALDKKTSQKLTRISKSAEAWGLTCVEVYSYDSRKACLPNAEKNGSPPYPPESFDRILLDAPCSALGQRPCSCNNSSLSSVKSFPVLQKTLITEAEKLLKPGGVLVYSTCTITLQENEEQVAWTLKTHRSLKLQSQVPQIGGKSRPCKGLMTSDLEKLQYFDPDSSALSGTALNSDNDTIGFFIAKYRKTLM